MRLKFLLICLLLIHNYSKVLSGVSCNYNLMIMDTSVKQQEGYGFPEKAIPAWVSKFYITNNNIVYQNCGWICFSCCVYIHPGDTCWFGYDREYAIDSPGHYFFEDCVDMECVCPEMTLNVDCYYLTDDLQLYYQSHFDKNYIDSVNAITSFFANPPDNIFYPNPVTQNVTLKAFYSTGTAVAIAIYNVSGVQVLSQSFDVPEGLLSRNIDLSMLETGVYIVKYTAGAQEVVKRILKI